MSATPKMGVHLRVIGLIFSSPPFWRVCFTPEHILLVSRPLHSTLSREFSVQVATTRTLSCEKKISPYGEGWKVMCKMQKEPKP
jgi:hypothetical protein